MPKTAENINKKLYLKMVLLLLGTICFFATNHIFTVVLPLMINARGFGLSTVGYCAAAMGLMTILSKFITPLITKKIRTKLLVISDLLLMMIFAFAFIYAKSGVSVIILRALFGIPFSIFPILNLLIISQSFTTEQDIAKATSIIGMGMPISMILSPIISEWAIKTYSYNMAFFVAGCFAFLSSVLYSLGMRISDCSNVLISLKENEKSYKKISTFFESKKDIYSIGFPIFSFIFLGMADILMLTYFSLFAEDVGASYSFFFSIFAISMVTVQALYSRIKLQNEKKLIAGYILLAASIILVTFYKHFFLFTSGLSALLFGMGYSLVETTTNTIVIRTENNKDMTITIQQLSVCIGRTIAPWIASIFASSIQQLRTCFLVFGASLCLPIFLSFYSSIKRKESQSLFI